MFAVISSLFAGGLIALAAAIDGEPLPILILALSAICAFLSHSELPLAVRRASYWLGLALALVALVYTWLLATNIL